MARHLMRSGITLLGLALLASGCMVTSGELAADRVNVEVGAAPVLGPADAPVTLVEFADFECPFCGEEQPVLAEIMKAYEGRVRLVFKHYPLSIHEHAELAAEASLAAHAQGAFWPYHDALYADQGALGRADLIARAGDLGLDVGAFGAALDARTHAAAVAADVAQGDALGVTGTPALFVNGRLGVGALPFDVLASAIEEELAAH